jgi:hypothetical protein
MQIASTRRELFMINTSFKRRGGLFLTMGVVLVCLMVLQISTKSSALQNPIQEACQLIHPRPFMQSIN